VNFILSLCTIERGFSWFYWFCDIPRWFVEFWIWSYDDRDANLVQISTYE